MKQVKSLMCLALSKCYLLPPALLPPSPPLLSFLLSSVLHFYPSSSPHSKVQLLESDGMTG